MAGFAGEAPAAGSGLRVSPSARATGLYERHATGLYRQALVTLGDEGAAGQVVADVIASECERPAARGNSTGAEARRLAVSVYWRTQQVAAGPAGSGPGRRGARERGALALVLYGGLEYRQASAELAIPPAEMAALLRTALRGLTTTGDLFRGRPQA